METYLDYLVGLLTFLDLYLIPLRLSLSHLREKSLMTERDGSNQFNSASQIFTLQSDWKKGIAIMSVVILT